MFLARSGSVALFGLVLLSGLFLLLLLSAFGSGLRPPPSPVNRSSNPNMSVINPNGFMTPFKAIIPRSIVPSAFNLSPNEESLPNNVLNVLKVASPTALKNPNNLSKTN